MEKKKLLLVAISVGVFLVIVIGAALLAFSPENRINKTVESRYIPVQEPVYPGTGPAEEDVVAEVSPDQPASIDAVNIIKSGNGIQGIQPLPVNSGTRQENNLYTTNNDRTGQPVRPPQPSSESSPVLITVAKPAAEASDTPSPAKSPPVSPAVGVVALEDEKKPASESAPVAVTVAAKVTDPVRITAAASAGTPSAAASARVYDTYWIQTGSFSIKARAEGVREELGSRGIAAIIENRDINGKTFFRVRIGPYTSKNEADYWLSLVKTLEGFEDSLVWQNKSRL